MLSKLTIFLTLVLFSKNTFADNIKFVGIIPSTGYTNPSAEVQQSALVAAQEYAKLISKFCGDLKILPIIITPNQERQEYINMISALVIAGGTQKSKEEFFIQQEMSKNYIEKGRAEVNFTKAGIRNGVNDWANYNKDTFEFQMTALALSERKPILGIDSGAHMLAIATGAKSSFILIPQRPILLHGQANATHSVKIIPNTKTSDLIKSENIKEVFSMHTKAITLGDLRTSGIYASATSDDGLIEAIENRTGSFFIGVQWHPEKSPNDSATFSLIRNFCEIV